VSRGTARLQKERKFMSKLSTIFVIVCLASIIQAQSAPSSFKTSYDRGIKRFSQGDYDGAIADSH